MTTTKLTAEQINYLEETIERRMANTGETREEACEHLANYLSNRIQNKIK